MEVCRSSATASPTFCTPRRSENRHLNWVTSHPRTLGSIPGGLTCGVAPRSTTALFEGARVIYGRQLDTIHEPTHPHEIESKQRIRLRVVVQLLFKEHPKGRSLTWLLCLLTLAGHIGLAFTPRVALPGENLPMYFTQTAQYLIMLY
ncbi:hypothetical protein AVEN_47269-1 [Araneus ventricosus]|uniref:Uncharacterized protein n=1 Tax=Araneus ventricosus TaxID=182803 RepID=A0A4Y2GRM2_ARAVE|nr:hypothetical protein AVEN_47269-1 [Araneus ventricosus]